ncbi:MAG TPA: F0F1 ATP synthase subunit A [Thermomicrobiales bacterium]
MEVHVEIAAETLFHVGPIPVTNSMLTMFVVMGLLLLVGSLIARRAQVVPGRLQSVFEMIVEFLLGLVEGTAGRQAGRRIFPLIGGIFIFILFANYSGLLPGVGTIGYYHEEEAEVAEHNGAVVEETDHSATPENEEALVGDGRTLAAVGEAAALASQGANQEEEHEEESHRVLVPFLRAPTADINMTLAMALVTFVSVQVLGVRAMGVGGRIKHMANPPFLFPIEVISEISRVISLSARLFGNVFAGEVLLGVMYAMAAAIRIAVVPFLFPVVFIVLELMFGAIQALVFALLTLIYITLATSHDHDEHHEHHEEHGAGAEVGHGAASAPAD